jgi:two-component system, NarL family, sensor kinase
MAELPDHEIVYIVIIGSLGMLTLLVGFVLFIFAHQKRMLIEQEKRRNMDVEFQNKMIQLQIDSTEAERKRIAADLHDSIGSLLWAAKLNLAFLGRSANFSSELQESYTETLQILDQSVDGVRRISWELTPQAFNLNGLSASVKQLCGRLHGKGQDVIFDETGTPVFWNNSDALMMFRIVQELVNNAVKHAQATQINITMVWKDASLILTVADNGIGFAVNKEFRSGIGWWNITNRSAKIGAKLVLHENVAKGSAVTISLDILV